MQAFGIDIGGSGIKGAPVDVASGRLLADRKKILTPRPSTPDAVADVVREVATSFGWNPMGSSTPAPSRDAPRGSVIIAPGSAK